VARQLLFDPVVRVSGYCQPDFAEVERQLKKDGVTLSLLWDEYTRSCVAAGVQAYQYSQYCDLYARWRKERGLAASTMRVKHIPGRLAEVDWAGARAEYVDRTTGEVMRPWVFVGCLPYSQRLFVEAFDDAKQPAWLRAHVSMLRFFGGVPELVTPDNCRTGVHKADYYDPEVNHDYARLAAHYGFAVLPARPFHPKDKASAENAVKFTQTWVVAYLRAERFFSLAELNQAVRARVAVLNGQVFQGLDYSRDDVFEADERAALKPLPAQTFELAAWRRAKVGLDYCVQVDRQRYSVPYRLIGQTLDVRSTDTTVEVFHNQERVCSHPKLTGRLNQASVLPEHMPEKHKLYLEEWNPGRFTGWAASVGPACLTVIESILASKPHPAQTYRACLGVLGYAKTKGNTFLEQVCQRAVQLSANPSYKQIKMLAQHPETAPPGDPGQQHLPGVGDAGLVRGAGYYRLEEQQ
jgi:transposase